MVAKIYSRLEVCVTNIGLDGEKEHRSLRNQYSKKLQQKNSGSMLINDPMMNAGYGLAAREEMTDLDMG
jgi:hypothetical protein